MPRTCALGGRGVSVPLPVQHEGLGRAGLEVLEARVHERRAILRYPALAAAFARVGPGQLHLGLIGRGHATSTSGGALRATRQRAGLKRRLIV